jgi:DNA-binding transcriptional ArsR family regulator
MSTEPIRDLSRGRKRFQVIVADSPLYDVMLATWSAFGGDDRVANHEVSKKWFDRFRTAVPDSTEERMSSLGLTDGAVWAGVLSYVAAKGPIETDAILRWLEDDSGQLVGGLLSEICWEAGDDDLERALAGDAEASERVMGTCKPAVRESLRALREAGDTLGPALAEVLASIFEAAYQQLEPGWAPAIVASAQSTRRLAEVMQPRELIEQITNGIDYEIPLGMTRLIAIPTVSLRPWTLVMQFEDAVLVSYPVADEHLEADPDAPPGWLVRYHKALGDDRRLRILRRLALGSASLTELTELVGLAKSTVFHHIGVLRAAGLIKVRVDKDSDGGHSYQLRRKALDDATFQLEKYLDIASTQEQP